MSKEIWYRKLKSYVPSWVFEKEVNSKAIFYGMAAVLNQVETDFRNNLEQTFIDNAEEEMLELYGYERGIERVVGEPLESYRDRVKKIRNRSNRVELKKIVDSLLINGECSINEHFSEDGLYMDSGAAFCDSGLIPTDIRYNAFTIVVPNQTPASDIYCDSESFLDDGGFVIGGLESSIELFEQIIKLVNENKAYGTVWRLYERAS